MRAVARFGVWLQWVISVAVALKKKVIMFGMWIFMSDVVDDYRFSVFVDMSGYVPLDKSRLARALVVHHRDFG